METLQIITLAFLVESVWETIKMVWQGGKLSIDRVGALILGLGVAVVYQVDLLAMVGITGTFNYVGALLTGVLISRGGNYIHDLVSRINTNKGVDK